MMRYQETKRHPAGTWAKYKPNEDKPNRSIVDENTKYVTSPSVPVLIVSVQLSNYLPPLPTTNQGHFDE